MTQEATPSQTARDSETEARLQRAIPLIDARRAGIEARLREKEAAILAAFTPHAQHAMQELNAILSEPAPLKQRLARLQALTSWIKQFADAHVACKAGCDYCCHSRVQLSQSEAELVGERVGRTPRRLHADYKIPPLAAHGSHTPCPFLKQGLCSIYEHRPMVCRDYVNVDVDNLLCQFENAALRAQGDARAVLVPVINTKPIHQVYAHLTAGEVLGDIRDFFPAGA